MTIKLIIFDFDGVLVDSEYIAGQVTTQELHLHGVQTDLDTTLRRFVGMHDTVMRAHLAEDVGEAHVDEFLKVIKEKSRLAYYDRLTPLPGAVDMLASLELPLCIGSNSRFSSLKDKLEITKLNRFFSEDRLYVGSMVPKPKPAPDLYLHAAQQHDVSPAECLVIEDSAHGIKAAVDAKMSVIGFYGASHCYDGYEQKLKQAGADILFDQLSEIPGIIKQIT
ncbi:MAG: HAD family phosphatase [OCS116 cluster bacterium]|uniref:HAD family hydrolase n=1 Tax=OCS116 cluster bacterium TaxID=2030921 RepID=A0A2A4Z017_9PROT|nr:HAD family phosphatase [OCS116 cluster bacterium]